MGLRDSYTYLIVLDVDGANLLAKVTVNKTEDGMKKLPLRVSLLWPYLYLHYLSLSTRELDPTRVAAMRPLGPILFLSTTPAEGALVLPSKFHFFRHYCSIEAKLVFGYDFNLSHSSTSASASYRF
jgi:hypothetical protein